MRCHGVNGCFSLSKSKSTGAEIGIYDTAKSGYDTSTPWVVVCHTHNTILACHNLKEARTLAGVPHVWCEGCLTP